MIAKRDDSHKDIFISYSRKQLLFASRLYQQLTAQGFNVWFDQNDIPLAVDFLSEIERGIRQSHYFLFLLSPDSSCSIYCMKEIEYAIGYGKRIIPVHCVKTSDDEVAKLQDLIARLNWIDAISEQEEDFQRMLGRLVTLLQTGKEQPMLHTELICRSLEWKSGFYADNLLLEGSLRIQAEKWLSDASSGVPGENSQPTALMCSYICESRKKASGGATDVFVSFDPSDQAIHDRVTEAFTLDGISTWNNETDHRQLSEAVREGIEQAENVLFILSPAYHQSAFLLPLLEYAASLHKRILMLATGDPKELPLPEQIPVRTIPLKTTLEDALAKLLRELGNEKNYYSRHRDLLASAHRWKKNGESSSLLLLGNALQSAQAWLTVAAGRKQHPAPEVVVSYVNKSKSVNTVFTCEVYTVSSADNRDFAQKLCLSLQLNNRSAYLGTADETSDQTDQLTRSDNFLVVVSPDKPLSDAGKQWVALAHKLGKRIVTVVNGQPEKTALPDELKDTLAIIFSGNSDDFSVGLGELLNLLSFDREYIIGHTRWLHAAESWEEQERSNDLLPRGKALTEARQWLEDAEARNCQPEPTPLQKTFIQLAHKVEEEERELALRRENYLKELEQENESLKQSEEQFGIVDSLSDKEDGPVPLPDLSLLFPRKESFDRITELADEVTRGANNSCIVLEENEGNSASVLLGNTSAYLSKKHFLCLECEIREDENSPFAALTAMAAELTALLLRNDRQLPQLKQRLETALQGNGKVLIDIMPHLELLLGTQEPVIGLDPVRARHRLKFAFAAFIDAIREEDQPIAVIVKNIQFANESLLDLLSNLLSPGAGVDRFLFIGSCSPDDAETSRVLEQLSSYQSVQSLPLQNLPKTVLHNQFVEVFEVSVFSCAALIDAIYEKTDGNPAMVQELLKQLYASGQFSWSHEKHGWTWDVEAIEKIDMVKDVEERTRITLQQLTAEQNQVLAVAACIGMQFPYQLLSDIFKKTFYQPLVNLLDLVDERLLIPASDAGKKFTKINVEMDEQSHLQFRFASNHLRKASITHSDPDDLKLIRIAIGRQFLRKLKDSITDEMIYNAATYVNEAVDILRGKTIKIAAANCNLQAGELALQSSAYQSALYYLSKGLEHLEMVPDFWEKEYVLSFKLHILHAKARFFCGEAEQAAKEMEQLISHAKGKHDKALCYIDCCNAMQSNGMAKASLAYAHKGLKLFGIKIPTSEEAYETENAALIELLTQEEVFRKLEVMPPADERNQLICELYRAAVISIYFVEPHHLSWICSRNLEHVLKHGYATGARQSMAWFSMVLMMRGNTDLSFRYADLATDASEHNTDPQLARGQTAMIAWGMSLSWKYTFGQTEEALRAAFNRCQNNGDPQYANYTLIVTYIAKLMQADQLLKLLQLCQRWRDHCEHFAPLELGQARIRTMLLQELMGIESTEAIDPEKIIRNYELTNNNTDVCESLIELARVSMLFDRNEEALMYCIRAEPIMNTGAAGSLMLNFLNDHVYAICCARIYHERMQTEQEFFARQYETKGTELLQRLKAKALLNPDNFETYYQLSEAEWAAARGEEEKAVPLYLKVALHKRVNDFPLLRAMAFEGLARFCHARGYTVARTHAEEAILKYAECGAIGKARQLETWVNTAEGMYHGLAYSKTLKKVDENTLVRAMLTLSGCENEESLLEKTVRSMYELSKPSKIVLLRPDAATALSVSAALENGTFSLRPANDPAMDTTLLRESLNGGASVFSGLPKNQPEYRRESALVMKLERAGKCSAVLYVEPGTRSFSDAQKKILRVLGEQYAHLTVN